MARLMVVLRPQGPLQAQELIPRLLPVLGALEADIDHEGPAHLSAVLRVGPQGMAVQLFADVQPQAEGPELDVVLMSGEPMSRGALLTQGTLQQLIDLLPSHAPDLELIFRSDRDGPLPRVRNVRRAEP